ncbi:MAG: NUDIX domain-containing protein [Calditrichaeota bacterium]|nr:MAG: NUDIX domain-containing protein [Calditrichota bacterium]
MNFCSNCGHKISFGAVPDDDRPRYHCEHCGAIHYQNPRMIVGCLARWEDQVLLCKRAIEPRYGLWTLPAGFMENGETVEEGALRETLEEANAQVKIVRLFSVYSLPAFGQVYLTFLADLQSLDFKPGKESLEVKLFTRDAIPWDQLAFSAIKFSLQKYARNGAEEGVVYLGTHERR